jgi:WD40 repeat protein
MLRTAAVSTVLVVVLATLSTLAHVGRRDARNAARESQLRLSHSQAELGVRLLQEGDASGLLHLVDAHDSVVGMPEEAASRRKLWSGWYAAYAGRLAYIVGHKAQLTSLEYNATGTLLATGAVDGSVRVWHADTGKPVGPVLQHGTRVRDLTFSPDSTMLAVGTSDGVVSFWNPWTGASYGDPIAHDLPGVDAVVYVSFSADGQYLATTGEGYVSKIWDVAARASSTPWTISHERRYPRAFFAPGGTTIVVEQRNRRIPQLWDVSTRALIPLPIDPAFSTPYRYDPSSRFIVAILPGNKAQLFDLTTRHMSHEVELLAEHDIEWARASDDGRVIAGALRANASRMPVMQLWDAHTGEPIGVPVGYDSSLNLYTMRFSPDGRWVAVAAYGHRVRLIDTVTGEQHGQDRRHPGPVVDLIFSPDSTRLAVGARGGSVWVWNTTTLGLPVESVTNARDVRRTTSSPNGRYSAEANVGRVGSVLRVRQAGDGKIPYLPTVRTTWLWSVAFSPDSRWMAAAYLDGAVWVTEVESGLVHGDVLIHPGQAMAVAFEPSSSSIVVAARRYVRGTEFASRLHLWDHQSGEHLGESQEFPGSVAKIAFAPGGDVLAMMLDDEARPQLWDVDTWRQHDPLPVAQGPLGDIVFHPTLPILAAASADLSVHLWDISTGEQVTSPLEYADAVSTLAFNGDGSLLAAGTVFGKVHIWETTTWRPYTQTLARPGVTSIRGVWFRDGRIMTTDSHDSDLVTHSYSLPTTADPAAALDLLTYAAVGSRGGAHRTVEPLTWQAWQSIQTRLGERRSRLLVSHPGPRRTAISSLETTASGDLVARVGSGRLLWNAPKERWEPLAEAPPPSDLVAVGRPFALGALATIPRWLAAAVLDTGPVQTSGIPTDWIAAHSDLTEAGFTVPHTNVQAGDKLTGVAALDWRRMTVGAIVDFEHEFQPAINNDHCVVYALCRVWSPTRRYLSIGIGADDAVAVWVNGAEVFRDASTNEFMLDQHIFSALFEAGENMLMVKVAEQGGGWQMQVRIEYVEGMRVAWGADDLGQALEPDAGVWPVDASGGLEDAHVSNATDWQGSRLVSTEGHGVFRFDDIVNKWEPFGSGLADKYVTDLAAGDDALYASTQDGYVQFITEEDPHWRMLGPQLAERHITAITVAGEDVYVGAWDGAVLRYDAFSDAWVEMPSLVDVR